MACYRLANSARFNIISYAGSGHLLSKGCMFLLAEDSWGKRAGMKESPSRCSEIRAGICEFLTGPPWRRRKRKTPVTQKQTFQTRLADTYE